MRLSMRVTVVATAAFAAAAGGYVAADAADMVPGWITDDPPAIAAAPFPIASPVDPIDLDPLISSLDSDPPLPDPARIQERVNTLVADPRVNAATGIIVVDVLTGEVLGAANADLPHIPASTAKLLTAAATMMALGGDARLTTAVTWAGAAADGATRITLVAGGDMMLAADAGTGDDGASANGYAGLGDLADEAVAALSEAGVTTVRLTVDDHAFGGPVVPAAWPAGAVAEGYVAPVSGLAVNVGVVPGSEDPTGANAPDRYVDPSMATAQLFAVRLAERGIVVESVSRANAETGDAVLASVDSAPLNEILDVVLTYSTNTVMEVLIKVVALDAGREGSTEAGTDQVLVVLREAGLDTTGITLRDGSGYTRQNKIPVRALTDAIVITAADEDARVILEYLPLGGLTGTLSERYVDTDAAGVVRAKTGSLRTITALSGTVVTEDGRWLAFAVLADGLPVGQSAPRAAIDEFVNALAACGCG